MASLAVNRSRLMESIHSSCVWGSGERWGRGETETGMSRASLSDADKQVRDWFAETMTSRGCKVTVDQMGNQFAVRPGLKNDAAPTFAGSHLDTQPAGGRYDGILGVTAAMEMVAVLNENWIETEYPVGVVNWTNEEGARFPVSMISSGVWSGEIPLARAHELQEVGGGTATMRSELERIGYLGSVPCSPTGTPMAAHFELHIEQGPHLVTSGQKVGIVEGVQAYRWFNVTVKGREAHTGTTAFEHRADAMLAASRMIVLSHNEATRLGCLASTGILTLRPGSVNTLPGTVTFSLDIRSHQDEKVDKLEASLREKFTAIARGEDVDGVATGGTKGRSCEVSWENTSVSPAVHFHSDNIQCVTESATAVLGGDAKTKTRRMVSGAGHDSVYTSKVCPTSMIFVPCRDGVSHHPEEYCAPEDCAIGAQVLTGAVLRYDRLRASR